MRDFTLAMYQRLLKELRMGGFEFVGIGNYLKNPSMENNKIILRHDVDKKPFMAQRTAELEEKLGIKGTYYFRVKNNGVPEEEIRRIVALGHEIGYHYEDMNTCQGKVEVALKAFQSNLALLRETASIETICMHGSPLSKYDNRELWKSCHYRDFGIIGEPYFDIDFDEVLYLTDTGRRWDGDKVSIRDKVIGDGSGVMDRKEDRGKKTEKREQNKKSSRGAVGSPVGTDQSDPPKCADDWCCNPPVLRLHSTEDIIAALKKNLLPNKIMLTIHPQRWTDQWLPWIWEKYWQNMKNCVKYFLVKILGNG